MKSFVYRSMSGGDRTMLPHAYINHIITIDDRNSLNQGHPRNPSNVRSIPKVRYCTHWHLAWPTVSSSSLSVHKCRLSSQSQADRQAVDHRRACNVTLLSHLSVHSFPFPPVALYSVPGFTDAEEEREQATDWVTQHKFFFFHRLRPFFLPVPHHHHQQ